MKKLLKLAVALILLCCFSTRVQAQFTSGSDGSDGPLLITVNTTLDLPPDGIFNYTTIEITNNVTLTFNRNENNTPVYMLATGDVLIRTGGRIRVSGSQGSSVLPGFGGPGGFDGGSPGSLDSPAGAGQGPGGGLRGDRYGDTDGPGAGGYANVVTNGATNNNGSSYGSALLIPLIGGSGGGGMNGAPGWGGGGGGGAILIASDTQITVHGFIESVGGNSYGGGGAQNAGSGGAIRLVAPVVDGGGEINTRGPHNGGDGRIRIDTLDRSGIAIRFYEAGLTSIGSLMAVFPDPNPRLDIVEAAGDVIPVGSAPRFVLLPFGSDPNRTVKVRATDFGSVVPIRVALLPDNGDPVFYDADINNSSTNPAETTVNVTFPLNVQTTVQVWTR